MAASTSHLQPSSKDSPRIVGVTCRLRKLRVPGNFPLPRRPLAGVGGVGKPSSLTSSQGQFTPQSTHRIRRGRDLTCLVLSTSPLPSRVSWEHFLNNSFVPKSPLRVCFQGTWPKTRCITKKRAGETAGQSKTTAIY